jgi:predicted protein tyrosine phosphatase
VIISSRVEASRLLTASGARGDIRHVISIGDPGEPMPDGLDRFKSSLRLVFYDVDADTDFEHGPAREDVQAIIDFAREIADEPGDLLVHCSAGVSRSSAAALVAMTTWLGPTREDEAIEWMYATSAIAQPNPQLVHYADALLGRHGALVEALADAERAHWGLAED